MSARYAIYYAPAADSPLSRRASAWLGRDAFTGEPVARPAFPALADLDLDALTADPRDYGFHATLKAPFELASDRTEDDLLAFARAFAADQRAFETAIAPAALGRFIAFRPSGETARVRALHEACLHAFEPFRAPLSDFDLARRGDRLTPEQDAWLRAFGYPYVMDDFRFHLTLTGPVPDEGVRARLLEVLTPYFADAAGPHRLDAVAVFFQPDRGAPFRGLERFAFGG